MPFSRIQCIRSSTSESHHFCSPSFLENTNPFSFGGLPRDPTKKQGFITLAKLNSLAYEMWAWNVTKNVKTNICHITIFDD